MKDISMQISLIIPPGQRLAAEVIISERTWEEVFSPMPDDHDCDLRIILSDSELREKRRLRLELSKVISAKLSNKIMELVESQDPVKGIYPKERP